MRSACVVVPIYNDWESFAILLGKLSDTAKTLPFSLLVVGVDDGSTDIEPAWRTGEWSGLEGVEILQLAANVGHQRAIAIGLCSAIEEHDRDGIVVMDGDGEDPPEGIRKMWQAVEGAAEFCVVAQRRKRTENLQFRAAYLLYKTVFRVVTGKRISFGNFSLSSRMYAKRLVMTPELWNNLAAAVLRSKLLVTRVPVDRNPRYAGYSKMNVASLVVHGLSAMSVYAETIYVRMLMLTASLMGLAIFTVPLVLALRIFLPARATPGWATTVTFGLTIIFLQVFLTTLTSILTLLNSRTQAAVLPMLEYRKFIASRRRLL